MTTSLKNAVATIAMIAVALMPFAFTTPAFAAAPNWDTTGAYTISFDLGGTPYVHDLSLTQTGASLSGNGGYPAGGPHTYTWVLTSGSVDGDTIDFYADYTASADAVTPQTTMHVTGTISGGTMSGTWSDNYQAGARNGTWVSVTGAANPIAPACAPATMILSSDTGTTYKGQTNVNPGASSADGSFTGGPAAAVVAGPDGYPGAWDTAGLNPAVLGASWVNDVSVAPTNLNGGQVDTWRLFSESFTLPAGSTVSSASVSFSADNSADAFFDDALIGSVADFNTVTTSNFAAAAGTHELEFVTKNFAFDGATNPTAVIYKATIEYCVPVVPPTPVSPEVHIFKYIDGVQATAINADNATFPMITTFDSSVYGLNTNVPFTLSPSGWGPNDIAYEASYVGGAVGDDYATNEVTGGAVVGASCADGKPFALVGYTTGDTLIAAEGGVPSLTAPSFTNLQSDKYVIVHNTKCPVLGSISGYKFHDVNGNGVWNAGEPGLSGWTFNLTGSATTSQVTGLGGAYTFSGLAAGWYKVKETMQPGWTKTTPYPTATLALGENKTDMNIGNACFVKTGGKGKGYWTNKNGEKLMKDGGTAAPELALLSGYNLRNWNGTNFNPTTYTQYEIWNWGANSINMSYMLSAQLSALILSKEANLVDGTKQVVATDPLLASVPGMSPLGIITIDDLITAADAALGADGHTPAGDPNRAYQKALKDAIEDVLEEKVQLCAPFVQNT